MGHGLTVTSNKIVLGNADLCEISANRNIAIRHYVIFDPRTFAELGRQLIHAASYGYFDAPAPVCTRWTAKNCPLRPGDIVRHKASGTDWEIRYLRIGPGDGVFITLDKFTPPLEGIISHGGTDAETMLRDYTFNGQPCGELAS